MLAMSFMSAALRWLARAPFFSGNESPIRSAWLMRGLVPLLAACHLPQAALAFIPPSESVPVSATVRRQLEHAACKSSFSVGASAIRTWRWSSDGPPDLLRARVSCQPDSDFKGMPARYQVDCERHGRRWICDAAYRELLVSTAMGTVVVVPDGVHPQQGVDVVRWLATQEFFEAYPIGRIPMKDTLEEGCFFGRQLEPTEVTVECGSARFTVSLDEAGQETLRLVAAEWFNP